MIVGLCAGTYTVTVTDFLSATTTQTATVTQPTEITSTFTVTPISCFGENCIVTYTGNSGSTPTYTWDFNGATIVSGSGIGPYEINFSTSGVHSINLVVTENGCTSVTTTQSVTNPSVLNINISSTTNISCNGGSDGSLTAIVSGGVSNYSYYWSNLTNTPTITNLNAGIYSVTVLDGNGCSASASTTITEPTAISVSANITDATCLNNDGQIIITVSGGIPNYIYTWSPPGFGTTATNLPSGNYISVITDANGCSHSNTWTVNQSSNPAILSGTAHYSGGNIPAGEGIVNLFMKSNGSGSGQFDSLTSQTLTSTGFLFNGLYPGKYFIKVDLTNPTSYPNLINTYYDNTFLWTNADTINLVCNDTINIPVHMFETSFTPPSGNCDISGSITLQGTKGGKSLTFTDGTKAAGEPVPGAEIIIEQEPNDVPVQCVFTDQNGEYIFTNIEIGSGYHLLVDIPGYPMLSTFVNIIVGSTDTLLNNYNFLLDTASSGGILIENLNGISNPFVESGFQYINVYPNPVSEYMNVNFELTKDNSISIDLINETGTIVKQLLNIPKCKKGTYNYQLKMPSSLSAGNYFIQLKDDRNTLVKKIILKK